MILPIAAYGHPVLRKKAEPVAPDAPGLADFIQNMFDTMYAAEGVGLAAPQVGKSWRIFVIDTQPMEGREPKPAEPQAATEAEGLKAVFINPEKLEEEGAPWPFEEGCLSIPNIREAVERPARIRLRWLNERFEPQEATFEGMRARVIQHEYDHLEGVLFLDHLTPMRRSLLKGKLTRIARGQADADYKMMVAR